MEDLMKIRYRPVLGIIAIIAFVFISACAPAAPTAAPAKPSAPGAAAPSTAPTGAPAPAGGPTSAPAAAAQPAATQPPAPATATKIKRGGVLKFANATEPSPTLDPHTHMASGRTFELLYGNFTKYVEDTKTGKWSLQPWYAESWEQPDSKTIVMKLKKGIKFQDGTTFNADVAKYNLDRMMTNKMSTIRQDIGNLEKTDIVDDYTIKLSLKSPPGGLLVCLSDSNARGFIISKDAAEKLGDDFGRKPVGSGPMQFVEWLSGDHITLKRWDNYWEMGEDGKPLPYMDGIEYRIVPDSTAKMLALRAGTLDASDALPLNDAKTLQSDPNFQVHVADFRVSTNYFFFNTTRAPWKDNKKLRQALLYSIDGKAMADALGFGMGKPNYYHWGPADLGYDETLPRYDYQIEKAKQLMSEAGFATGLDIELMHWPTWPHNNASQVMQQMWAKIGVRASLRPTERTATEKAWMAAEFDVGLSGKQVGELDPTILEFRFRGGEIKNYSHYADPELDKCFDDGRATATTEQRVAIYKNCQRLIFEDAAFGVPWQYPLMDIMTKNVKGWTSSWRNEPNWTRVWLDK
jgi:peptide/nickel transport system substrate-binding protein